MLEKFLATSGLTKPSEKENPPPQVEGSNIEGLDFQTIETQVMIFPRRPSDTPQDEDGITFGDRTMIPRHWVKRILKLG